MLLYFHCVSGAPELWMWGAIASSCWLIDWLVETEFFPPVKWLVGKIISEMTCCVLSGMSNPTVPCHIVVRTLTVFSFSYCLTFSSDSFNIFYIIMVVNCWNLFIWSLFVFLMTIVHISYCHLWSWCSTGWIASQLTGWFIFTNWIGIFSVHENC